MTQSVTGWIALGKLANHACSACGAFVCSHAYCQTTMTCKKKWVQFGEKLKLNAFGTQIVEEVHNMGTMFNYENPQNPLFL